MYVDVPTELPEIFRLAKLGGREKQGSGTLEEMGTRRLMSSGVQAFGKIEFPPHFLN